MVRQFVFPLLVILLAAPFVLVGCQGESDARQPGVEDATSPAQATTASTEAVTTTSGAPMFQLPQPDTNGPMSLEEAIRERRSVRDYSDSPLSLEEVGQLLWATQGITSETGARAAPSAGGTFPLELYVAVGRVNGLETGIYHYLPHGHELTLVAQGDLRAALADACLDQQWVGEGAIDIIVAADFSRTTGRYGDRGIRYVHLEAGHAAQNLCLQATALGLGAVTVGAFSDQEVAAALHLPSQHEPLYVMPVGRPASE